MDLFNLIIGILLFIGGTIGFLKRKSVMSLVASSLIGSSFVYSSYLIGNNDRNGVLVALIASIVLSIAMGIRFLKGKKFMPAGLVTLLGIVALIRNILIF